MAIDRKTSGITLLRLVAGQAIKRKRYATFTHEEIKQILKEVDEKIPRSHRTIPLYKKQEKGQVG